MLDVWTFGSGTCSSLGEQAGTVEPTPSLQLCHYTVATAFKGNLPTPAMTDDRGWLASVGRVVLSVELLNASFVVGAHW